MRGRANLAYRAGTTSMLSAVAESRPPTKDHDAHGLRSGDEVEQPKAFIHRDRIETEPGRHWLLPLHAAHDDFTLPTGSVLKPRSRFDAFRTLGPIIDDGTEAL